MELEENYLYTLPDELIYQVCQNMDTTTLVRTSESSALVRRVCSDILAQRKISYLNEKTRILRDKVTTGLISDILRHDEASISKDGHSIDIGILNGVADEFVEIVPPGEISILNYLFSDRVRDATDIWSSRLSSQENSQRYILDDVYRSDLNALLREMALRGFDMDNFILTTYSSEEE